MDPLMKFIGRTSRCAILYRGNLLTPYGLNGHQHSYIIPICQHPGITQDKLAQIVYVNKSNVARQISLLEQNGFVTRIPGDTDRRQMRVYPTDKLVAIYPKILEVLTGWNEKLLEDFNPGERQLLMGMMEKITEKAIQTISELQADEQNSGTEAAGKEKRPSGRTDSDGGLQ